MYDMVLTFSYETGVVLPFALVGKWCFTIRTAFIQSKHSNRSSACKVEVPPAK